MMEDIEKLSHDEAVDQLAYTASIGDRMDHRDVWEMKYLLRYIKQVYDLATRLYPSGDIPEYECPECENHGYPSIYYNSCTVCANKKREVY